MKNGKNKQQAQQSQKPTVKAEAPERIATSPAILEVVKDAAPPPADTPKADTPKKAKKISEQVKNWKAQKAFPMNFVITEVRKDNPKRKDASRRFALYEEGMTVQAYTDKAVKEGITKALAMADMRWDHCAGFVTIVEPAAKPAKVNGDKK